MGKIGEWREILKNAAERAAFWARLSWSEAREEGEGVSESGGGGGSGEEIIERESGENLREKKELWIEKEAARSEREERAEKSYNDNMSFDAQERERERIAVKERFEKEAEIGEGYFAEDALRGMNGAAEKFAENGKIADYATAISGAERYFAEIGEKAAGRTAQLGKEEMANVFALMSGEDGAKDLTAKIGAGKNAAADILSDAAIEAAQRRGSYGISAEMKREMLKMKMSEMERGGEVRIEPINNNYFESEVDMDEITDRLTERIVDLMARSADGIY